MTLLVGIVCEDGAVIAADRQVSHGALGTPTVGMVGNKVFDFGGDLIYAVSGPISLAQQLGNVFTAQYAAMKRSPYFGVVQGLQNGTAQVLIPALRTAKQASEALGQAALMEGLSGAVLAVPFQDGLKLIEVNHQGRCEYLTRDTAFICVGSGKANADPFIRFLWSVFWTDRMPNVEEGVLTAYWTIKVAIQAQTFGVGYGVDIAYLKRNDAGYALTRLSGENDFLEHEGLIMGGMAALRTVREQMRAPKLGGANQKAATEEEASEDKPPDAIASPKPA